jgi:hypothetical protein
VLEAQANQLTPPRFALRLRLDSLGLHNIWCIIDSQLPCFLAGPESGGWLTQGLRPGLVVLPAGAGFLAVLRRSHVSKGARRGAPGSLFGDGLRGGPFKLGTAGGRRRHSLFLGIRAGKRVPSGSVLDPNQSRRDASTRRMVATIFIVVATNLVSARRSINWCGWRSSGLSRFQPIADDHSNRTVSPSWVEPVRRNNKKGLTEDSERDYGLHKQTPCWAIHGRIWIGKEVRRSKQQHCASNKNN